MAGPQTPKTSVACDKPARAPAEIRHGNPQPAGRHIRDDAHPGSPAGCARNKPITGRELPVAASRVSRLATGTKPARTRWLCTGHAGPCVG